jgi:hypothetical protein
MLFKYCVFITNHLVLVSSDACRVYVSNAGNRGLRAHLGFLNDPYFVEQNLNRTLMMWDRKENSLIEFLLLNLSSLTRNTHDEHLHIWSELNAVSTFTRMAEHKPDLAFTAYNAAMTVATDRQLETAEGKLAEAVNAYADMLAAMVSKLADSIANGTVERKRRGVVERNAKLNADVAILKQEDTNVVTSLVAVMQGLHRLALTTGKWRRKLYSTCGGEVLRNLLQHGNAFERMWAARVIAQFSFNSDIASDMGDEEREEFVELLDRMIGELAPSVAASAAGPGVDSVTVFQAETYDLCRLIKWNMSEAGNLAGESETDDGGEHVLLSYDAYSERDRCERIRVTLESLGYIVSQVNNTLLFNHKSYLCVETQAKTNLSTVKPLILCLGFKSQF